jgi:hypothetical protein
MKTAASLLALLLLTATATAADIYVSATGSGTEASIANPTSLAEAIGIAEANNQDDTIYIQEGTYRPVGGAFTYDATADDGSTLTFSGSWDEQFIEQPAMLGETVLDGGGITSLLHIEGGGTGAKSTVVIRFVKFRDGYAETLHGGALRAHQDVAGKLDLVVEDCIFESNDTATGLSGGAAFTLCDFTMRRCVFDGNHAENGGALAINYLAGDGPALRPLVEDCVFRGNHNTGGWQGSAVVSYCSPEFRNCRFVGRTGRASSGPGSTFYAHTATNPTLVNCRFEDLVTDNWGSAIELWNAGATISGCLFANNDARGGRGAVSITNLGGTGGKITITNSTFVGNRCSQGSGAALNTRSHAPKIHNSIFWDNGMNGLKNETSTPGATLFSSLTEDDLAGTSFTDGGDNIFGAPTSPFGGSNYWLAVGSPCVDAGRNSAPDVPAVDLYGLSRIEDGDLDGAAVVDMGAFEMVPPSFLPYSGTIGTQILMVGTGYGEQKPKVWLQYRDSASGKTKKKALKVLEYGDTRCVVYMKAKLPTGRFTLKLMPKDKTAPEISVGNFSIVAPSELSIVPASASPTEEVGISGLHIGDRKAKVKVVLTYEDAKGRTKKKTMKVVKDSLQFDPVSGVSSLRVVVPKLKGLPITGRVLLTTKIAREAVVVTDSFTVE